MEITQEMEDEGLLAEETALVGEGLQSTLIPLAEQEEASQESEIRQTWNLLKSRRMLALVPLIVWSSASLAIFSTLFVSLLTQSMPGTD